MKRIWATLIIGLCGTLLYGQADRTYVMAVDTAAAYQISSISSTWLRGRVKVKTPTPSWTSFLNQANIKALQPMYPQSRLSYLQRLYRVSIDSTVVKAFEQRPEIKTMTVYGHPDLRAAFPNDYYDTLGRPMTALQLIRAPRAWQVTKGDSSVIVGMVDRGFDFNHEDLQGKFAKIIRMGSPSSSDHGTGIAGIIAGKTDNGKGLASVGRRTRLAVVVGNYALWKGLDSISKLPGIKIISCSWGYCHPSRRLKAQLDSVMRRLQRQGILVIASAGNGEAQHCRLNADDKINGYRYPASFQYDNVISVTSVGHKFLIGNKDQKYGYTAWRDCHDNSPLTESPNTHTHNDAVDICAPGYHLRFLQKADTYRYDGSGTSEAVGYVAGTAALMLAVNPELTGQQLREIILNTADDISYIPYNERFEGSLGSGRLNTYRAVLTAKCMASDTLSSLDLMLRDGKDDFGEMPYHGQNYSLDSPDIWVRHQQDGKVYRQSQSAVRKQTNYVYVRVTNRSCRVSSGTEKVEVYAVFQNEKISLGKMAIPKLAIGEEGLVVIPWKVSADLPQSLRLVVNIKGDKDEVSTTSTVADEVVLSNNVAWKSVNLTP